MRTSDARSKSPTLANNRTIYTYYHWVANLGTAQSHVSNIYERVQSATDAEAHELVARFRAAAGGDDEELREYVNENARALRNAGYAPHGRTTLNSDGSIDAELRIDLSDGDFHDALLTFGDETTWPKEI